MNCELYAFLSRMFLEGFLAHLNSWVPKAMDEIINNHKGVLKLEV